MVNVRKEAIRANLITVAVVIVACVGFGALIHFLTRTEPATCTVLSAQEIPGAGGKNAYSVILQDDKTGDIYSLSAPEAWAQMRAFRKVKVNVKTWAVRLFQSFDSGTP